MIKYFLVAFLFFLASSVSIARVVDEEIKIYEKRSPTGKLEERFRYYIKDGIKVKHGKSEWYHSNGEVMGTAIYQHGQKNGRSVGYYKWIGKRSYETEYVADRQEGWSRQWSPQGELLFESKWKEGVAVSGRVSESALHSGLRCEHRTVLYENGNRVAGSEKKIPTTYERPASTNQLPNFKKFLRWSYPSYEYGSTYRFQYYLPKHSDIPEVLAIRKAGETKGEIVIDSQLEMLTRFEPKYGASITDKQLAWENWWKTVGSQYTETEMASTQKDPTAWAIACKGRTLPIPENPIIIPQTYTLTFNYQAGDYDGRCEESMVLKRTASKATLTRIYSTKTNGPKISEHWQGMTTEQADTIVRAVGHVIDNPWLQNDEVEINRMFWELDRKNQAKPLEQRGVPSHFTKRKQPGRTSFSSYYGSSNYELKDADGNVWWNISPTLWYGDNEDRYNWNSSWSGLVYSFFVEQYPDSQKAKGDKPGWKID